MQLLLLDPMENFLHSINQGQWKDIFSYNHVIDKTKAKLVE